MNAQSWMHPSRRLATHSVSNAVLTSTPLVKITSFEPDDSEMRPIIAKDNPGVVYNGFLLIVIPSLTTHRSQVPSYLSMGWV